MDFRFSPEIEAFRQEVKDFIKKELTPEAKAAWGGAALPDTPPRREFLRKLGRKGWLGLSWPKEYGGQGLPGIYEYILSYELVYAGAPHPGRGVGIVGKTLIRHGSDRLKKEFLPKIARDDIQIALGYTEPEAGSDLASLKLKAVRDGDDFIMNGQKLFSTSAHFSEYVWLAVRTSAQGPKQAGISLFVADLKVPGVTIKPMWTMAGEQVSEIYFDNARVPGYRLVGELNRGWQYITEAMALERFALATQGAANRRKVEALLDWVRQAELHGKPIAKDPLVRQRIAELVIESEVLKLFEYDVLDIASKDRTPTIEAAINKLFGSELDQRININATKIMGLYGQLQKGSKYVLEDGKFEMDYRASVVGTIAAGSSEIQRNIIALRLLNLPK